MHDRLVSGPESTTTLTVNIEALDINIGPKVATDDARPGLVYLSRLAATYWLG